MRNSIKDFFWRKFKFALSSSVATVTDYSLYIFLVSTVSPVVANLISAGTGMVINFILQKRFIFKLDRKVRDAFAISLLASLIGIGISTLIIYYLNKYSFFIEHQYVTKALAIGIVFFYNFYSKRYAFERKVFKY